MQASEIGRTLREEKALCVSILSAIAFLVFGGHWFDKLNHYAITGGDRKSVV